MMSQTMKRYQTKQSIQRDLQEVRRKEIQQICSQLNVLLVDKMNSRVEGAYINQKKLQGHTRQLQYNSANLQKQSEQWLKLLDNFNEALKEIGDVSNWAKSLENEMTKISHTLAYAYKGEVENSHSGDSILE
jgi:transposase